MAGVWNREDASSDGWAARVRAQSMDAIQARAGMRRAREDEFLAAMGVVADAIV